MRREGSPSPEGGSPLCAKGGSKAALIPSSSVTQTTNPWKEAQTQLERALWSTSDVGPPSTRTEGHSAPWVLPVWKLLGWSLACPKPCYSLVRERQPQGLCECGWETAEHTVLGWYHLGEGRGGTVPKTRLSMLCQAQIFWCAEPASPYLCAEQTCSPPFGKALHKVKQNNGWMQQTPQSAPGFQSVSLDFGLDSSNQW